MTTLSIVREHRPDPARIRAAFELLLRALEPPEEEQGSRPLEPSREEGATLAA